MPETTSHQLVVFSLGSEEYALPIRKPASSGLSYVEGESISRGGFSPCAEWSKLTPL